MVYKKYIKRNGRIYGPYSYRSRKENGKVITEYLGSAKENNNKNFLFSIKNVLKPITLILILAFIFFAIFFINSQLTGKVSLQIDDNYLPGEQITGNLKMSLTAGELIPANTKIIIDNSGEISEYLLSDLISEELISGNFYTEGKTISGKGQGYGVLGEKKIYPTLNFELKIKKNKQEKKNAELINNSEDSIIVSPDSQNDTLKGIPKGHEASTSEVVEDIEDEIVEEVPAEEPIETPQTQEETQQSAELTSGETESMQEESVPITGEVVSENEENKIVGQVSKDAPFVYDLQEEETAEIKQNSVELNEERIGDENINLEIKDNQVVVTTDYYYVEKGFGEEYLTDEEKTINIDLTQLGLIAQDGNLIVKLVYGDAELTSSNEQINVEEPILEINKTIIEKNATEIIEQNITREINETEVLNVVGNVTTLQYRAVINRPVKWIKTIRTDKDTNTDIELPKKSVNISIKTGEEVQQALTELQDYENVISNTDKTNFVTGQITGQVSIDIEKNEGIFARFFKWLSSFGITGNVISEEEVGGSIVETTNSRVVDVDELLTKANVSGEVDVGIEYYTDAPAAVEEDLINRDGKKIIISSSDGFDYKEILAYSVVSEQNISMSDVSKIKIYWYVTQEEIAENLVVNETIRQNIPETIVNETQQPAQEITNQTIIEQNITKEEVNITPTNESLTNNSNNSSEPASESSSITGQITSELTQLENNETINFNQSILIKIEILFNAYDLNKDGYVDYVEWIVPHLSEQVYEIIYIEKAVHLDENKNFIEDIYEQVKEKDNNWSETINNSHYVRVTFEQPLDKTKDITLYARSSDNETSQINVYTENSNESIAIFENITNENWYKVYLNNLNTTTDVFDLKIISQNNSGIEFDYIVDPVVVHNLSANWTGTFVNTTITGNNVTLNYTFACAAGDVDNGDGTCTATFYPDADPETSSVDGTVRHSPGGTPSWADIRDGAGTHSYDNTASNYPLIKIYAGGTSDVWNSIDRSIFLFNTSSLPDDAIIKNATLSLYGFTKADIPGWTPNVNIYSSAPASNTALVAGDFDSLGTTAFSTAITYANFNITGYNDFALNADGINVISLTAISKFGARNANYDVANSPPTWESNKVADLSIYFSEQTGTANDPKLVVTYNKLYYPSGTYQSQVIDAGSSVVWNNLSFNQSGRNLEGWDYTGVSYDITLENYLRDIFYNGSNWFVVGDGNDNVSQYNLDFSINQANYSVSAQDGDPIDIYWNGSNWFMVGYATDRVYKYYPNWTYAGGTSDVNNNWSIGSQDGTPRGIFWNGSNWFMVGSNNDKVWEYLPNWTATGNNWSVAIQDGTPNDIYWDGTNWWMAGSATYKIYKYYSNWTYTGTSYSTASEDGDPNGIFKKDDNWYMLGYTNKKVYKYDFNLKFQLSSCNDASCSGETLVGSGNTSTSYFTSSPALLNTTLTPDNRWFQYKTFFLTGNTSLTPHLASVTLDYTVPDTTNPNINLTYPLNTTYTTNVTRLNYTFTETSPDSCWYSFDNGVTNSSRVACGTNWTGLNSNANFNTWKVYANDTSGNQNTSTISFSVIIPPVVSIVYPTNDSVFNIRNIPINYSLSGTVAQNCWWSNNSGTTNTTLASCGNLTNQNWADQSNQTVYIWANSSSGTTNGTSVYFRIDTIAPAITWTNPANDNSTKTKTNITMNIQVSDSNLYQKNVSWFNLSNYYFYSNFTDNLNGSAITTLTISDLINITGRPDGTYRVKVEVSDTHNAPISQYGGLRGLDYSIDSAGITFSDGNFSKKIYFGIKPQSQPARLLTSQEISNYNVTFQGANANNQIKFNLSFTRPATDVNFGFAIPKDNVRVINTTKGEFIWEKWNINFQDMIDSGFNISYLSTNDYYVIYSNTANCPVAVGQTCIFDPLISGLNIVTEYREFVIDTINPSVTINYPINYSNFSTKLVNINSTIIDANLAICWYSNNSGKTNNTFTCGTNLTTHNWIEGINNVTIYANDSIGNKNNSDITFRVDTIKPSVTINYPTNTFYSTNVTQLNYTASDSGIGFESCWYSLNLGQTNSSRQNCGTNWTGLSSISNQNTWTVYANDSVGNLGNTTINFTVDIVNPQVTINYPINYSNFSTLNVNVNFTIIDTNLQTCWYSNNSGKTNNTFTCGTNLTTHNWIEGINNITIYANDSVGNKNNSDITFRVDMVNPQINLTYPLNITYSTNQTQLNYTYTEANPDSCWYSLNSGQTNSTRVACGTNWTGLNSNANFNTWKVYANDTSGNQNTSTISFSVDIVNPQVTINYPINYSNFSTKLVNVNFTIIDTNLAICWYTNNSGKTNNTFTCGTNLTTHNWIEGINNITIYANDSVGNWNLSDITFRVDTIKPAINLISPINNSGDSNGNITFNYNVTDVNSISNCSLIFDGIVNQTNISITKDTNQNFTLNNLPIGDYNWGINCTDFVNNINLTQTRILAVIITNEFSGETTDLSNVNISNITNLIIHNPEYGKINFSQSINLSGGADINNNVNISFNRIEVNSSALAALNKTARLYFYNLTYTNPRPLKDDSTCSATICTEVSYSGGTFVYNVTEFSVYSSEETPVTPETPPGGGGGGGGGEVALPTVKFDLDKTTYETTISFNYTEHNKIKIKNNENYQKSFNIEKSESLEGVVFLDKNIITLGGQQSADIEFTINSPDEVGIYTGKIIISSGSTKKEILIVVNVKTDKSLFDVGVTISDKTKRIKPGENLKAQINLLQAGIKEKMDVTLNYIIKDFDGIVHYAESETIMVYDRQSLEKDFHIGTLPIGDYVLGIELIYSGGVAVTSSQFKISEGFKLTRNNIILLILTGVVIILIIATLLIIKKYKRGRRFKRIALRKKRK